MLRMATGYVCNRFDSTWWTMVTHKARTASREHTWPTIISLDLHAVLIRKQIFILHAYEGRKDTR